MPATVNDRCPGDPTPRMLAQLADATFTALLWIVGITVLGAVLWFLYDTLALFRS